MALRFVVFVGKFNNNVDESRFVVIDIEINQNVTLRENNIETQLSLQRKSIPISIITLTDYVISRAILEPN